MDSFERFMEERRLVQKKRTKEDLTYFYDLLKEQERFAIKVSTSELSSWTLSECYVCDKNEKTQCFNIRVKDLPVIFHISIAFNAELRVTNSKNLQFVFDTMQIDVVLKSKPQPPQYTLYLP